MALSHQYSDIFLSYSRGNSAFVRQLFERLDEGEVQVWIDWDDIPPTAEWWHEIETGIDAANTFVFVMSAASLSSPVCHMELAHAIASNKRIVPVLHEQADRSQATRVLLDRVAENAYIQALLAGRDPQAVADENWTLLESLNWLFMRATDDFDTAFATLIQSLNTDIDHVRAHTRLLVRAREWDTRHRENSFLLGGQQITEAENWLAQGLEKTPPPTALQMEYISASRLAATRRQRLIQSSMLVALVGTIVFSVLLALAATDANEQRTFAVTSQALAEANEATAISNAQTATVAQGVAEQNAATATVAQGEAFIQRDRADEQAQLALSRQLAAQASTLFTDAPEEALLIALEAFRIADTEEARRSLIEGLQTAPQIRYAIQAYPNPIQQLHFSPDSRTMATIDNEDGLLLWDVETAQQLNLSPDIWWSVNTAQFDDTGNLVTVGALSRFATWDSRTGAPISLPALTDLSNTSEASLSTALSRDGRRLATFQPFLSRVALTDTSNGDIIVSIDIGDAMEAFSEISEIALSDRGDRLLMYGGSTLSLWDESTGAIYEPADEFVYTAALSPNGQLLAWAEFINQRAIIRVWAVEKQSMLTSIEPGIDFPIRTLQFDEASHVLYYGTTEGSVGGHDVLAQEVVLPLTRAHTTSIEALAINATGDLLLSGDETGVVILWDINQTDRLARHLTDDFSRHVRYLGEDQRYLLAANVDLAIYDLQNPAEPVLVQPTGYDQYVRKIAWDADRSLLATLGGQGSVLKLWHVQIVDGQPRIDLLADDLQRDISDMDFSPDGHYLLTVADDHINAFAIDESMGDWTIQKVDLPDVPAVSVVTVDPANNRLATGQIFSVGDLINSESSTDNKVTLYSLDERGLPYGDPMRTIILPQRFLTVPWLIAFSPDGTLMAATDIEGNIGIWSLTDESAAPLLINSPLRTINSMQFSADSTLLLTTNTEGEIQQWDVLSGREAGAPLGRTGNPLLDLDVDASGSIVAASEDGILLWRFDDEQLANLVCERANLVLSPAQWRQYFGDVPYRASCPDRSLTAADLLMLQ
ncbi:MAG: TIR domain-containing protein, partial [Anaerolineae bacterium]|nr:TIR domain-containing protein [Anaerolineae bacterium]